MKELTFEETFEVIEGHNLAANKRIVFLVEAHTHKNQEFSIG